ncbi:MAG TPA: hypothetical protein VMN82_16115 [Thermoanaerobaculia bacterium]|nr:hypothetical protein [Thermoanaerobaculia bacterium]
MTQSSLLAGLALDAFMPALSPAVALAFLGTGFLLAGAAVGAGVAAVARRARLARGLAAFGLAVAVVYATLLAAAAVVSRDRTLAPGERKYFCEMDCHLAYEVTGAEAAGPGLRAVTVRTWFDPSTIAPFRGDGPYAPSPRSVFLVDRAGRRYSASSPATEAWRAAHGGSTPFARELRPGESYSTTFVFEAPADAGALRLFIGDADGGVERLLIGHENSPWHGKVYFALPEARKVSG